MANQSLSAIGQDIRSVILLKKSLTVINAQKNLIPKLIFWSIREYKSLMNVILKFEQEGEQFHQLMNALETRYISIYNKAERYFLMLNIKRI